MPPATTNAVDSNPCGDNTAAAEGVWVNTVTPSATNTVCKSCTPRQGPFLAECCDIAGGNGDIWRYHRDVASPAVGNPLGRRPCSGRRRQRRRPHYPWSSSSFGRATARLECNRAATRTGEG